MASYLLIGDSHMEALGPRLQQMLGGKGHRVGFVAHRGWSVRRYVRERNLERTVWARQPYDTVVIELGGNDGVSVPSPEQHAEEMRALVEQLIRSGAIGEGTRVVWFGPAVADSTRTDHDAIAEIQRRVSPVKWIDSRPLTKKAYLRSDRLHFTGEGYTHWAEGITRKLTGSSKTANVALLLGAGVALWGLASYFRMPPLGRVDELALEPIRIKKAQSGRVDVVTERGIFEVRKLEGEWWITFPGKPEPEAASPRLEDALTLIRSIE